MATKVEIYNHYCNELKKLLDEIEHYRSSDGYFYSNAMMSYVKRYNDFLTKYHQSTGIPLEKFELYEYDYSGSGKTVRDAAVERYKITLRSTRDIVEQMLQNEKEKSIPTHIPSHQMRKCLKTGVDGCPRQPMLKKNQVFVGMPFDDGYLDSYEYGIRLALEALFLEPYKANNEISNKDIMCKICMEMQSSNYLLFNISGLNPNVMLELGLSYGLGKETIVVKDKSTKNISDIASIEYIEYAHAAELREKLMEYFRSK